MESETTRPHHAVAELGVPTVMSVRASRSCAWRSPAVAATASGLPFNLSGMALATSRNIGAVGSVGIDSSVTVDVRHGFPRTNRESAIFKQSVVNVSFRSENLDALRADSILAGNRFFAI